MHLRKLTTAVAALALASLLGQPANADTFNPAQVPADSDWVIHVDMDQLTQSAVGKQMISDDNGEGLMTDWAKRMKDRFGLDVKKDVHGMTLYGHGYDRQDAAMLVNLASAGNLAQAAQDADNHQSEDHHGITIHSWTDKHGQAHGKQNGDQDTASRKYGALLDASKVSGIDGGKVLVLSDSKKTMDSTVDRLSGQTKTQTLDSTNQGPLTTKPESGSWLFMAAKNLQALAKQHHKQAFMKNVDSLVLQMGQGTGSQQDQVSATLQLKATNADQANNFQQMLQGFVARGRVSEGSKALSDLANAVSINQQGQTVTGKFTYPVDKLITDLKQMKKHRRN